MCYCLINSNGSIPLGSRVSFTCHYFERIIMHNIDSGKSVIFPRHIAPRKGSNTELYRRSETISPRVGFFGGRLFRSILQAISSLGSSFFSLATLELARERDTAFAYRLAGSESRSWVIYCSRNCRMSQLRIKFFPSLDLFPLKM